jgi:hypothetical protein
MVVVDANSDAGVCSGVGVDFERYMVSLPVLYWETYWT